MESARRGSVRIGGSSFRPPQVPVAVFLLENGVDALLDVIFTSSSPCWSFFVDLFVLYGSKPHLNGFRVFFLQERRGCDRLQTTKRCV